MKNFLLPPLNKALSTNLRIAQDAMTFAHRKPPKSFHPGAIFSSILYFLIQNETVYFEADKEQYLILIGSDTKKKPHIHSDVVYISCSENKILPLYRVEMSESYKEFAQFYDPASKPVFNRSQIQVKQNPGKDNRLDLAYTKHLITAFEAKHYAKKTLYRGCTNANYPNEPQLTKLRAQQAKKVTRASDSQSAFFAKKLDATQLAFLTYAHNVYYKKIGGVGNCGESAQQALAYARRHFPSVNSEYAYLGKPTINGTKLDGDHAFLVVGRDRNTRFNTMHKWNKEAIICDPWTDQVYPAAFFDKPGHLAVCMPDSSIPIKQLLPQLLIKSHSKKKGYANAKPLMLETATVLTHRLVYFIEQLATKNIEAELNSNPKLRILPYYVKSFNAFQQDLPQLDVMTYLQEMALFQRILTGFYRAAHIKLPLSYSSNPTRPCLPKTLISQLANENAFQRLIKEAYEKTLLFKRIMMREPKRDWPSFSSKIDKISAITKCLSNEFALHAINNNLITGEAVALLKAQPAVLENLTFAIYELIARKRITWQEVLLLHVSQIETLNLPNISLLLLREILSLHTALNLSYRERMEFTRPDLAREIIAGEIRLEEILIDSGYQANRLSPAC
ncbi:MAG: hypothetical protein WC785_02470 [Tatlockia sp.]